MHFTPMTAMTDAKKLIGRFERSDFLYLVVLAGFCFLLLSQVEGITVKSYDTLVKAGVRWDLQLLPVTLGLVFLALLYVALRLRFSQFDAFLTCIIVSTSITFTNAFAAGSFLAPVTLLYGYASLPVNFTIERVRELTFLLPLAVLGVAYFALRKNAVGAAFSLFAIALSFGLPVPSLPLLAVAGAFGLGLLEKESKEEGAVFAFVICAFLALYLMGQPTLQSAAFAVFAGALMAAVLYIAENRRKLNAAILLSLVFVSALNGFVSVHLIDRVDSETLSAMDQLKALEGRIAVASIYGNDTVAIAKYVSGKDISVEDAAEYMFSTSAPASAPGIDYLLLDTLVLDNPSKLAALANKTVRFETFALARLARTEDGYFAVYASRASVLALPSNERGALLADYGYLNGERVSLYRFLLLEADNPRYSRYVYPRGDTNLNILKLLFPEQFGALEGVEEVWRSDSSRMRLYKLSA